MSKEQEESIIDHPAIKYSRSKRKVVIDHKKEIKQLKAQLAKRDKAIKEAIKALSLNEKEDDVTYYSKDEYALSILLEAMENNK